MALLRYWAGARAAAGVESERVEATNLQEALDAACAGRDERFSRVIRVCSFVVDEQPVGRTPPAAVSLTADAHVEVLPPFAGGARANRQGAGGRR
ncbi:MAG: MoaD/ThiS family protein [Actinomycetes bacterium]